MTSNQHGPYVRGYTRVTMGGTVGCHRASGRPMKLDSLVIAHQPWRGEYVPGPCTHRPSSHESREYLKCVTARSALGQDR